MSRFLVSATWDDAPHLSREAKDAMWASIPPYQRGPRAKGIPQLGAGVIYSIPEEDFVIPDIPLRPEWPRGYGMDVGWNRTAAIWCAYDRETQIRYLYREYYRGEADPVVHAAGIKAPGLWIPGRIDSASHGRSQEDGRKLIEVYKALGLQIGPASAAIESGIYQVWAALTTGKLKVFRSCVSFLGEYRLYRRDEKGRIVKQHDHLMDAVRYLVISGVDWLAVQPVEEPPTAHRQLVMDERSQGLGWMGN